MEVLYRNPPIFGAQPAAGMLYPPAGTPNFSAALAPRFFSSPSDAYTCYPFQSGARSPHTPSRTPTPEYPSKSASSQTAGMFQGNTLKSVLRGEVPEAYSHFLSTSGSGRGCESPRRHSPLLGKRRSPYLEVVESPAAQARAPAAVLSPPPEDVQTEPMDLSFKRPCSAASSGASSPASFHHTFPPSPAEEQAGTNEFSLLRNLLQVGKLQQSGQPQSLASSSYYISSSPSTASSATSDRSCDSPCSDNGVTHSAARHLCGSTRVTLAKKNMYPVSSRVQDWLMKAVQFAQGCGYFQHLPPHDRLTLLLNAWSRLLLLFMAESNLQFATTPLRSQPQAGDGQEESPSPDEPTVKSVESIQSFIRKCQAMNLDSDEYNYMRLLVLFNSSYVGLTLPCTVDSYNSQIQQSLQQHVQSTRPADFMHYSRLLMSLPSLYGISAKVVENLFCKHVLRNTAAQDMDLYLKDLLASSPSVAEST